MQSERKRDERELLVAIQIPYMLLTWAPRNAWQKAKMYYFFFCGEVLKQQKNSKIIIINNNHNIINSIYSHGKTTGAAFLPVLGESRAGFDPQSWKLSTYRPSMHIKRWFEKTHKVWKRRLETDLFIKWHASEKPSYNWSGIPWLPVFFTNRMLLRCC